MCEPVKKPTVENVTASAEAGLVVAGACVVAGASVLMIMKALLVPLVVAYVLLAVLGLRTPRRIIIRTIHWAWTHRSETMRAGGAGRVPQAGVPRIAGGEHHAAISAASVQHLTAGTDPAAIAARLTAHVEQGERQQAVASRPWRRRARA